MPYAEKTQVPVDRSKAEIEKILSRYGAESFGYLVNKEEVIVSFFVRNRKVRFHLPMPKPDEANWEQRTRTRWRGLVLCIKAKLQAVEDGIVSFDEEFGMHIVLGDGKTLGDHVIPQIEEIYKNYKALPMLSAV